jgi:hypothetical protein
MSGKPQNRTTRPFLHACRAPVQCRNGHHTERA